MTKWYNLIKENDNEISLLIYIEDFLSTNELKSCKEWLNNKYLSNSFIGETTEQTSRKNIRKQLWYQEDNGYFCEKWKDRYPRWKSNNYDNELTRIQNTIREKLKDRIYDEFEIDIERISNKYNKTENTIDTSFDINSCLVNLYETGNEGISPHRDNSDSFGIYPTIIGLSIGATRTMKITRNRNINKTDNSLETIFEMKDNSLFIMMGASQKYYTHEIIKEPHIKEKRYSFTFRKWLK